MTLRSLNKVNCVFKKLRNQPEQNKSTIFEKYKPSTMEITQKDKIKKVRELSSRKTSTAQELYLLNEFDREGIPYKFQEVVACGKRIFVFDFLLNLHYWGIFSPVVLECSITKQTRRNALQALISKAENLDYKFRLIKKNRGFLCVALLDIDNDAVFIPDLIERLSEVFSFCDLILCDTFSIISDLKTFLPAIYSVKELGICDDGSQWRQLYD